MSAASKFGKLVSARTHEEARALICCACWKKVKKNNQGGGTVSVVSEKLSNLVRQFVFKNYSVNNSLHPTAMCVSCRLTLCSLEKV